ncbi:GntR family transcriptional regulator [Kineosporia rhizophila]|uniref:GntR family transcriptional regulator n=1 Tax=Kineosporia TaxID=49184 RepID=UPI001E55B9D3|nr:GntR family transcriptional regulator [Kineosporia sp. NBRC 101677]MCE0534075.1 GntR family transcriptional regulator [Kineosporia rhizophila]
MRNGREKPGDQGSAPSLREATYDELRSRIVNLVYAPGQRLFERDLAAELEVSRIPLREALQLLANDGLVVLVPRQGALVAPFTAADVRDLFDVRESLEVLAARLAAHRVGEEGLAELREQIDRARGALAAQDHPAIAAANSQFHRVLVRIADNPLLTSMMRPLEARTQWLFHLTRQRDLGQQCDEHQELYDALAAGDAEQAARCAFEHVTSGREDSIALAREWSAATINPVEVTRSRRR